MESETIADNININMSTWHLSDGNGPSCPIVCVLCDRFIIPDSKKFLSLSVLKNNQHNFFPDPTLYLSEELIKCYQINFPSIDIPLETRRDLDITKCLLSPRSSYVVSDSGENGFHLCDHCHSNISRGKRPKFCIASNFCFGTPPKCLLDLSDVELAVITPIKTHGYCFCYTGGQKHKLKGSLAYYKTNKDSIILSIANLAAASANVVIVIYGELTKQQYIMAQQKNKLRINMLHDALRWLIENNSEWKNLACDNIDELVESIQNPKIVTACNLVEDNDVEIELDESFNAYYPDGSFNNNTGGQESIEVLQELVREASINHHDIACRFNLLKESVHDYKDNNLVNACLLQFPYGRGGMDDDRLLQNDNTTTSIDIKIYIEYLSMVSQPHFHGGLFSLILYNMMMKQNMVRTAHWQIRHKIDATMLANELNFDDVEQAINSTKVARGIQTDEARNGNQLLKAIDAVCNSTAHSNDAAKKAKGRAKAIQHKFGCPTFFLTVTPDDDNCYTIQVLSGEIIDYKDEPVSEASDEELIERAKQRTTLRLKYPGICALYFELALKTVIKEVFGWDTVQNKQESTGLFGEIDAFTCSIEEQGRSTLHAHFLIWCSKINKKREALHDPEKSASAALSIKKIIDKVCSTKCFFNDLNYLRPRRGRRRRRFLHTCENNQYGLPTFPDDEQLLKLRSHNPEDEKLIKCHFCEHRWSYKDLQDSYLKDFIGVAGLTSFSNENKVKRLKAMAIEYQQNIQQGSIPHYAIDFGYNSHYHTPSCFKHCKCSKKRVLNISETSCRYRYPQRKKLKTFIQNISSTDLPWYNWNGSFENRYIKEVCLERKEYDAFQNTYCQAISYSKLTCNTNLAFLVPGPIGESCFNYSLKGTQYDDTEPYEKVKGSLEKILSVIKYNHDDRLEATKRLLAASFVHQSTDTLRPTMAAYLTRNKSRFIFSHEFVWCPLRDLRSLLLKELVSVNVSFHNKVPYFRCYAMHYLCRPQSLESLNPYEFYSKYEIVKCSKRALSMGGERLINTQYFHHPSYKTENQLCEQLAIKRIQPALIQICQFDFPDAANFDGNILSHDIPITDEIEGYCQLIVLLFLPYRCDDDLKLNDNYTTRLRVAVDNGIILSEYSDFLQNIQDSKGNSFRFKITNDDLDRASEPFHSSNNHSSVLDDMGNLLQPDTIANNYQANMFDLTDLLLSEAENIAETFDMQNSPNIRFNMSMIRKKGKHKCGFNCLPDVSQEVTNAYLNCQQQSILETSNEEPDTTARPIIAIEVIDIKKKKNRMALIINYDRRFNLSLKEILGKDEEVHVQVANGTASSITDWAIKCGLDNSQQRAFEIIAGYYILSYIYSIPYLDEDTDTANFSIKQEKLFLEQLVGFEKIQSNQLVCFLHGPGGSGKSTVISLLQCYSKEYHILLENQSYNRSIVITAMTGVAATIIGGETTHSALHLNHIKMSVAPDKVELWTNTKLVVIDEISFATNKNIKKMNQKLTLLKDKQLPFGGIHVIFCGDLRQLEPIDGKPLYKDHETIPSEFKNHINCYIELVGKHRFVQDTEWGEILFRFREGKPTDQDIAIINTRVQDPNTKMPNDIKYATYSNKDRDSINTGIFQEKLEYYNEKYGNTARFILIFCDKVKIKKHETFIPFTHRKFFYENCGESDAYTGRQGKFDPVLKLYEGCEVMLTENIDVINGLANGTQALVKKVLLNPGGQFYNIILQNNIVVKAVYASDVKCILLQHKNPNILEQIFKIKPKQTSFQANLPIPAQFWLNNNKENKQKIPMQATQIPIILNNATTGHKLQGTGVDKLFVHTWHYKTNWPYVVLSRVRQLSGLFLREPLNLKKKFKFKMHKDLESLIEYFKQFAPIPTALPNSE